jgi:hypothetical protein
MKHKQSAQPSKWPTKTIGLEWPLFSEDTYRGWLKYKNLPDAQRARYRAALRKIEREKKAGA